MRRLPRAVLLLAALATVAPAQARADDVEAPWRMSLVDVQGRGVMIERLDIRSFVVPLLQPGDIIIGVDERRVGSSAELKRYLQAVARGEMVVFTVERDRALNYVMLQVPQ